jgi:hypothetical protein
MADPTPGNCASVSMSKQFVRFSNATSTAGGRYLSLRLETDGGDVDLEIAAEAIPEIIQYLIEVSSYLDPAAFQRPAEFTPIPAQGLGLVLTNPEKLLILVRTACVELSFEMSSSQATDLARDFVQMAQLATAPSTLPQ